MTYEEVLKKLGFEQRTDFDTGTTSWIDTYNDNQRVKTPGDMSINDVFAPATEGFGAVDSQGRPRYGTEGWVRGRPSGVGDPSLSLSNVNINGQDYSRGNDIGDYDWLNSNYGGLVSKFGVTPNDFTYNDQYGQLMQVNPRTQALERAIGAQMQKGSFLDKLGPGILALPMAPFMLGGGPAALGAAEGAGAAVGTGAFDAGVGGVGQVMQGLGATAFDGVPLTAGAGAGGGMGDFWNEVFDTVYDAPSQIPELEQFISDLGPKIQNAITTRPDGSLAFTGGASSGLTGLLQKYAPQLVKSLLGNTGGGNGGGLAGLFSGGGLLGDGLNLATRIGPGIAALEFAKNQNDIDTTGAFDTSKFNSIYGTAPSIGRAFDTSGLSDLFGKVDSIMDPYKSSVLSDFDNRSGQARGDMLSGLAQRGVMGSSFGNMDLANFDTMNQAQRGQLAGNLGLQGLGLQRNLLGDIQGANQASRAFEQSGLGLQQQSANSMLNANAQNVNAQLAQQAIRNALYGRAFDVLGRAVSPGVYGGR
jgi:hypothetical protein